MQTRIDSYLVPLLFLENRFLMDGKHGQLRVYWIPYLVIVIVFSVQDSNKLEDISHFQYKKE